MWGQDVGIVTNAVKSCTKNICLKWWAIVADAISIALGVEAVWIIVALAVYKVCPMRQLQQSQFLERRTPSDVGAAFA